MLSEDEVIASLPSWKQQITLRAILVGAFLGVAFSFITMRFSLGPGGIVPTFNSAHFSSSNRTRLHVLLWRRLVPAACVALASASTSTCRPHLPPHEQPDT